MAHVTEGKGYSLCCVGRKSASYFRFRNYRIDNAMSGFSDNPSYDDARHVAETVNESFLSEAVDQVELIYTEFVSMGTQRVVVRRFLPLIDTEMMAAEGSGTGPGGELRVRAIPRGGAGGAAAPLHRGPTLRRRCSMRPPRSTPTGSGR